MSDSIRRPSSSMPVHSLDVARPRPAKATHTSSMAEVVKDALADHHGKLEVAAREMGNMDPSQLSRDLRSGALQLKRLDALDDSAKAAVVDALHDRWGATDPKELIRREIREARSRLNRIEELIAHDRAVNE